VGLERRLSYSRSWYRKQLIGISTGQIMMTTTQFRALLEYGRLMGWNAKVPRRKAGTQPQSKLARLTDDLLVRIAPEVAKESVNPV
jgi:hypothetical protein